MIAIVRNVGESIEIEGVRVRFVAVHGDQVTMILETAAPPLQRVIDDRVNGYATRQ